MGHGLTEKMLVTLQTLLSLSEKHRGHTAPTVQ